MVLCIANLFGHTQAAGIGSGVAGCFTANRLISVLQNTNRVRLIDSYNPSVIEYTQLSAGLAISLGLLSVFLVVSIVLRIVKKTLGPAGKLIIILVSHQIFFLWTLLDHAYGKTQN